MINRSVIHKDEQETGVIEKVELAEEALPTILTLSCNSMGITGEII